MPEKTEKGLQVIAFQRSNRDQRVSARSLAIEPKSTGLDVSVEIGEGRGFAVQITLSLEEIVAWIPDLLEQKTGVAVREAERRMRSLAAKEGKALGVELPYLEGDPAHAHKL